MAELLVVRNLTRRFGNHTVLDGVSFELDAGQVCAAVGPNGTGKTTLLRCVVGADRPDRGSLRLAGRDLVETAVPVDDPRGLEPQEAEDLGHRPHARRIEHADELVGRPRRAGERAEQVEERPHPELPPHRRRVPERGMERRRAPRPAPIHARSRPMRPTPPATWATMKPVTAITSTMSR